MLLSPQLRIALLISFLGHLLCISSVSLVFLPDKLKAKRFPGVSFLGPILGRSVTASEATARKQFHYPELPLDTSWKEQDYLRQASYSALSAERQPLTMDNFVNIDTPNNVSSFAASFKQQRKYTFRREIFFRPPFPEYPEWKQDELNANFVVFKIYITPDGLVQEVINLQGSGDPEVDATLARYVRKWRFAPIEREEGKWQRVKIDLQVE